MIADLPIWMNVLFLLTSVVALVIFYYSNNKPNKLLLVLILWASVHSVLAYIGFYIDTLSFPPRFVLVLVPIIIIFAWGFSQKNRLWIIENRNIKISTFLHTVRIPIEICLFYLFLYGMVPALMTFEGRNFDILAGITAPIMGALMLLNKLPKQVLLVWNFICLGLIVFIFINGTLSAELPFQQFGFDQPNRAVLYFPFILLPALVVPVVIHTHLSDIFLLLRK